MRRKGRFAFAGALLLALSTSATAFEHPVLGRGRVGFGSATEARAARGVLQVAGAPALAAVPDPRCPAISRLRVAWSDAVTREIELPCAGWRAANGRYAFADRTGAARKVVVGKGGWVARLSGETIAPPKAGAGSVEVKLSIGGEEYCARFSRLEGPGPGRVSQRGRSEPCRLPRPNFLVINLDDVRADGIDRMPVVERELVGKGVSFPNSFVPFSNCCPSRASLLTGLYALRHGTRHIAGPLGGADTFRESGADQRTIALWLRDAGYRTALFGKYLNDYAQSEEGLGPGGTFYVPPGWDRWWAFVSPEHYGGLLGLTYEIVDEHGARRFYADHSSDAEYSTDVGAEELRAFIAGAVEAGRPFFAYWAPYAAHGDVPSTLAYPAARHNGTFQALAPWRPPSWNEQDVSDKPHYIKRIRASVDGTTGPGPFFPFVTDSLRRSQYDTLLSVDEQLALTLEHLEALGVDQDTVVILTSDNGLGWGEHVVFGIKECPYEECARVPMIVRYPRRARLQSVSAPVLNIDLAPTIAALAGAAPPQVLDGESFAGYLLDAPPERWRTDFLLERWRRERGTKLFYDGQVADGDRLRLYHGEPRTQPRPSLAFEFDAGDGAGAGAIPVAIGADDYASIANLGRAIADALDGYTTFAFRPGRSLTITPRDPLTASAYLVDEVDSLGVLDPEAPIPEYFGVRDVAGGYTWVEYETGERELYDLVADPDQLENRAGAPSYESVRARLATRLQELLSEILARGAPGP